MPGRPILLTVDVRRTAGEALAPASWVHSDRRHQHIMSGRVNADGKRLQAGHVLTDGQGADLLAAVTTTPDPGHECGYYANGMEPSRLRQMFVPMLTQLDADEHRTRTNVIDNPRLTRPLRSLTDDELSALRQRIAALPHGAQVVVAV